MWDKGKNEGLTQQFMNTFSSVSVAWSALHTNTRGRWVFLVTTTRSHFHLAQLACHLCAGFRYCQDTADLTGLDRQESVFDVHCRKLFCRLPKIEWDALLDSQRNAALAKWHRIVMSDPMSFEVCRFYFMNLVLFCPTSHHLRIYVIKTSSEDPCWESSLARI